MSTYTHQSVVGATGVDQNIQGGFDAYAPSVAGGKTYRAVQPRDYVTNAKPAHRPLAKQSFDEVGSPGWDEDAEDVSDVDRLWNEYINTKAGTPRAVAALARYKATFGSPHA